MYIYNNVNINVICGYLGVLLWFLLRYELHETTNNMIELMLYQLLLKLICVSCNYDYFSACPKDKNVFKLRSNIEKKISICVTQITNKELRIER